MSSLPPEDDQLESIREAIAQIFARLRDLEARLVGIESREDATDSLVTDRVVDEVIDAEVVEEVAAPESVPEPTTEQGESTRPIPWNLPTKLAREKDDTATWEAVVGGRWMTWAGALTLIVAVAFTIHWAWQNFDTPDWLKVTSFHALGLGLLVAGHVLYRRELKVFAHGLSGLGIFTLYAIAFSTLHHYELWGEGVAFVECSAITLVAIATAIRKQSVAIVLLGALGGYLTPLLTSTGSGAYIGWFTYLAFLNVALIGCAVFQSWNFLKPLAWVATAAMFYIWLESPAFAASEGTLWPTEWLVVLHGVIFLAGTTIPPVVWRRPSMREDLSALAAGSMWFVGTTYYLFHESPDQQLALVGWGMAVLHLVLFGVTYSRVTNVDRMPRVHLAMAAVFFTLATPLQLGDASYLAAAWCVEGLVFAAVGVYFRDRQMNVSALIVFVLSAVRLFGWEYLSDPRVIAGTAIDFRFFMVAMCGLLAMAAGGLYLTMPKLLDREQPSEFERRSGAALLALGHLVVLIAMTCQWHGRLILVLWTLDVAVVWAIGFVWRSTAIRWYAAALALGLVGGRAIYHFDSLDGTFGLLTNARFLSLAFVAALYFAAGWYYRKLRLAVAPDVGKPGAGGKDVRDEAPLDPLFGILGNVVLLFAITWEIHGWYGRTPFFQIGMAEQATYSVVWAVYAAVAVVVGFVLRYRVFRLLGLVGFAPILGKVFLIDLRNLEVLPRILAFAVLGLTLMAVSALYQKFAARIDQREDGG